MKSAFEKRTEAWLTPTHPLMSWLVENDANLRNGYSTTQPCEKPYKKHHT